MKKFTLLVVGTLSIGMLSSMYAKEKESMQDPFMRLRETFQKAAAEQQKIIKTTIEKIRERRDLRADLQKLESEIKKAKANFRKQFENKEFAKKVGMFLVQVKEIVDEQGKLLRKYNKERWENLQKYVKKAKEKFADIKKGLPADLQMKINMAMQMMKQKAAVIKANMMAMKKKKEEKSKKKKAPKKMAKPAAETVTVEEMDIVAVPKY
jgi:hypothetical protein